MLGDRYSSNTAIRNGGSLFLNWESLAANNVHFNQSSAKNGGAIYCANIGKKIYLIIRLSCLDAFYNDVYGITGALYFSNNKASNSGGALKLLFRSSELNEDPTQPFVFVNNNDSKGLSISEGRPSYYVFSFYNVNVEKNFDEFDNIQSWVENPQKTVIAELIQ